VIAGNTYAYRIAATNAAGSSAFIGPVSVVFAAPAAPAALKAVAARAGTTDTVTLTWTSVTNLSYSVQRGNDVRFQAGASIVGSNIVGHAGTTRFTDTNAPVTGPVFYRVGVQRSP